jgi:hypothetical protein
MPSKSKKYRRPTTKKLDSGISGSNIPKTNESPELRPTMNQSYQTPSSTGKPVKPPAEAFFESHFTTEVKWIGLVTAIIVILLIVAYYVFK